MCSGERLDTNCFVLHHFQNEQKKTNIVGDDVTAFLETDLRNVVETIL